MTIRPCHLISTVRVWESWWRSVSTLILTSDLTSSMFTRWPGRCMQSESRHEIVDCLLLHNVQGVPKKYFKDLTFILNLWSVFFLGRGTPCTCAKDISLKVQFQRASCFKQNIYFYFCTFFLGSKIFMFQSYNHLFLLTTWLLRTQPPASAQSTMSYDPSLQHSHSSITESMKTIHLKDQ